MKPFLVKGSLGVRGTITLPGDKSIAHRSIILSAINRGKTRIYNFPLNQDCLYTVKAIKKLGVRVVIDRKRRIATVFGRGLFGLKKPNSAIFVGDSGTTIRLLSGLLAGQPFTTRLIAAKSLSKRPMHRVNRPLRLMGAAISSQLRTPNSVLPTPASAFKEEYPPLTIKGGALQAITYKMPIASAQVKSAILLAGLYAQGVTRIIEPIKTRDHTERMLGFMKAKIKAQDKLIGLKGSQELAPRARIYVPGDISSASFFIVLAAILPESRITIKGVSLNPTRIGLLRVLKRMGANLYIKKLNAHICEPAGDITVGYSLLKGVLVKEKEIPLLIDELPILMVAACFAKGDTIIKGAGELRVKETDRIKSMTSNLKKMGAKIRVFKSKKSEDIVIKGLGKLKGANLNSYADHRTAMSAIVAAMGAMDRATIDDVSCIKKSFPDFLSILKDLR